MADKVSNQPKTNQRKNSTASNYGVQKKGQDQKKKEDGKIKVIHMHHHHFHHGEKDYQDEWKGHF